ncbi:MAG TPA: hypothetical protein VF821_18895, partial [Lentzea sp.]
MFLVLATGAGACSAELPAPAPAIRGPWKPPSLVNQEGSSGSQFVRDVFDPRTVELADGTTVRVSRLAEPAECWAASALEFART